MLESSKYTLDICIDEKYFFSLSEQLLALANRELFVNCVVLKSTEKTFDIQQSNFIFRLKASGFNVFISKEKRDSFAIIDKQQVIFFDKKSSPIFELEKSKALNLLNIFLEITKSAFRVSSEKRIEIQHFNVSSYEVDPGSEITITWKCINAQNVHLQGYGPIPDEGSVKKKIAKNELLVLQANSGEERIEKRILVKTCQKPSLQLHFYFLDKKSQKYLPIKNRSKFFVNKNTKIKIEWNALNTEEITEKNWGVLPQNGAMEFTVSKNQDLCFELSSQKRKSSTSVYFIVNPRHFSLFKKNK